MNSWNEVADALLSKEANKAHHDIIHLANEIYRLESDLETAFLEYAQCVVLSSVRDRVALRHAATALSNPSHFVQPSPQHACNRFVSFCDICGVPGIGSQMR